MSIDARSSEYLRLECCESHAASSQQAASLLFRHCWPTGLAAAGMGWERGNSMATILLIYGDGECEKWRAGKADRQAVAPKEGERIGCNPGEIQIQAACSYCSLAGWMEWNIGEMTLPWRRTVNIKFQTKRSIFFLLGSQEFKNGKRLDESVIPNNSAVVHANRISSSSRFLTTSR